MVDRTLARSMMSGLGAVGRPGARPAPMRGSPGETLASMQGGPNLGIRPSSFMALEGPETIGALTDDQLRMFRYQAMRESGLPEDVLSRIVQTGRERGQAIDAGARRGLYMEPSIAPTLTESQTRDIVRRGVSGLMPGPVGNIIARQAREAETARIRGMPAETDIFAIEGPEIAPAAAIAAALEPRARPSEVPPPVVPERAPAQLTREPKPFSTEEAFTGAMQAFDEASGQKDTGEKTVEDYMKEFSEVTGIDISGKPDKSAALMAFGLALMQNRAGSGFNVGNILRSVGEAGEKALPALEKAKQEAKASALAAGKYALEQIQAGKSAEAAYAKEIRERQFQWLLQERKMQAEAEKAQMAGVDYKNVSDREIMPEVKVSYGIVNGNTVLAKPSADANVVANAWNKYSRGEEVTNEMMGLLEDMSQSGAPALSLLYDRAFSLLSSFGVARPALSMGPEGATPEQKFNAFKLSVINEMKKIILQESQVSDYDRKTLNESFGMLELATTPEASMFALQQMITFFESRKSSLNGVLQNLYDPSFYTSQKEYDRTISFLNENMKIPYVFPTETNGPAPAAGAPVATIDLSSREGR